MARRGFQPAHYRRFVDGIAIATGKKIGVEHSDQGSPPAIASPSPLLRSTR